ncbi:Lrp/AsnC family transcriptional regulator [Paenibacillus macerans]|uniref:Lrp/AsnC family transcriptional regulator n=1 Tax=Paenibacillus macerans TaxID=44252 RepID=UPI003D3161E3
MQREGIRMDSTDHNILNALKRNSRMTASDIGKRVGIEHTKQIEPFREAIVACEPVLECHHLAGEYDYLLKVLVEDTMQLEAFLTGTLKKLPGVMKSNTMISLSSLKENINI